MSVKPDGLLGDIKTANVFHHPVKSKFLISILIFTFYIINQVSDFKLHTSSLIFMLFDIKCDLMWWFFLFYVLVFKIFLCCWRLMYVFIFLVKVTEWPPILGK